MAIIERLPEIVYPIVQVNKVNEIVDVLNDNLNMYYSATNPILTSVEGTCIWTITHNLGTENVNCSLYNGDMLVLSKIEITSANVVTVSLNSDTNILADTYKIVIISNGAGSSSGGTTNHAQLTNLDYAHSGHTGFMKDDASNLTSAGQKVFDGQWVSKNLTVAYRVNYPTETDTEYNLSSYLPDDAYTYEVIVACTVTASEGEHQMRAELKTDVLNGTYIIGDCISTSSKPGYGSGTVHIPINSQRKLIVAKLTWVTGTYTIYLRGYRRIGTNS